MSPLAQQHPRCVSVYLRGSSCHLRKDTYSNGERGGDHSTAGTTTRHEARQRGPRSETDGIPSSSSWKTAETPSKHPGLSPHANAAMTLTVLAVRIVQHDAEGIRRRAVRQNTDACNKRRGHPRFADLLSVDMNECVITSIDPRSHEGERSDLPQGRAESPSQRGTTIMLGMTFLPTAGGHERGWSGQARCHVAEADARKKDLQLST